MEHLCVVDLTYRYIFSFKFTLRCQQSDIVPIICTIVVDTDGASSLRISHKLFEKIRNDTNVIFGGLGQDDSWKKPEVKNLVTLSL